MDRIPPALRPRYPTAAACQRLAGLLRLGEPPGGQDWEIELADPRRVAEFLDLYESSALDDDERFTLMELIVASYNDLLEFGGGEPDQRHWTRLRDHLLRRFELHGYTVLYWALADTDEPENFDTFTPRAREVMAAVYGPRERWPRRPIVVKRYIDRATATGPSASLDAMQISDNRDGTGYELWWCRFGERADGERLFPSVAEAIAYAERVLGVPAGRWKDVPHAS